MHIYTFVEKKSIGCFSEDINMWPSNNVLNWYIPVTGCCNIYVDIMGLNDFPKSEIYNQ